MGLFSQTSAFVTDIPFAFGYQISPPIAWSIVMERMNDESQSSIDGRHSPQKAQAQGNGTVKRQDTFITGTGSRTGRAFDVTSGNWSSSWSTPYYDSWGMLQTDNTPGVAFDIKSNAATPNIEWAEIVLSRSELPVGDSTIYSASQTYAYVELASGCLYNYRVAMEYNKAIRLDWSTNGGVTWIPVMEARGRILERELKDNHGHIRLKIEPDYTTGEMWIEINHDVWLHHSPGADLSPGVKLPLPGNIRFNGKNCSWGFAYFPLRHSALTVTKGAQPLVDKPHQNAASASIVVNGLSKNTPNTTYQVATDGQSFGFTATATLPDAGDGNGSATAPVLTDATMLVQEVWSDHVDGDFSIPVIDSLRVVETEETQTWDDNSRCLLTSGNLYVNNYDFKYNGAFGNFALNLFASVNDTRYGAGGTFQRLSGIAGFGEEGIEFYRADPTRLVKLPFADKRIMMMVPLSTEVILDGWCVYSAVRWLCRAGNIHPQWLQSIPYWPDGPADNSCPWPILARGTGRNPKYKFTPEMSVWSILQLLVSDMGQPIAPGLSLPFFMGFDSQGQFRFQAFDPLSAPPVALFTTSNALLGPAGVIPVTDKIRIFNSTAQMRSEVNFQGLNAFTYQLMQVHIDASVAVKKAIGYRYPWLERNSRYGTPDFLQAIAQTGSAVSSMPSQVVQFNTIFQPWLNAGATILVYDAQIGMNVYVITSLQNRWGSDPSGKSGKRICESTITARNASAYPTASNLLF